MRTEQEMMELILKVANEDPQIRAVGMNGSKTNPSAPQDPFQDYDIVYFVTELEPYLKNPNWIKVFGEKIIIQMPDASNLLPAEQDWKFAYLMLFEDGNRIDLTLWPIANRQYWIEDDTLARIILDKDQLFQLLPPPTDQNYWIKKPNQKLFNDCCNEFWWVSTYVAKGLWRDEIIYAIDHLQLVREMLLKMIEWRVGIKTNFSVSVGKNYKYLKNHIDSNTWDSVLKTYPDASCEEIWSALFLSISLFENIAQEVSKSLNFQYELEEQKKVKRYLKHIYQLPQNAKKIF